MSHPDQSRECWTSSSSIPTLVRRFHEVPAPLEARLLAISDVATASRVVGAAVEAQTLGDVEAALDAAEADRSS